MSPFHSQSQQSQKRKDVEDHVNIIHLELGNVWHFRFDVVHGAIMLFGSGFYPIIMLRYPEGWEIGDPEVSMQDSSALNRTLVERDSGKQDAEMTRSLSGIPSIS